MVKQTIREYILEEVQAQLMLEYEVAKIDLELCKIKRKERNELVKKSIYKKQRN